MKLNHSSQNLSKKYGTNQNYECFFVFFFSDMKYFDDTRNEIVITFLMPLALHDQPRAPPYPTLEIQPLKTFNQSSIFLFSLFSFFYLCKHEQ
jgi:hypothetical protein